MTEKATIQMDGRATYQGVVGTITAVSGAADTNGRYLLWTLTYDEPRKTDLICGCHPEGRHRYLGVVTRAEHLVPVEKS